jgi:peroxiredoxin
MSTPTPPSPPSPREGAPAEAPHQSTPARGVRKWRVVAGALIACTIAVLGWALLTPGGTSPGTASSSGTPLPAAPQVGHLAPNVTLLDLSNHPIDVASLRSKVVILNFWYVACEPCRYEMPLLERVYHADLSRGVVVIGVNIADDAPTITTFINRLGVDYPILRDQNQRAVLAYQITSTPTSFVIDRQGVIRDRLVGAITDTNTLNADLAPLIAAK